METLSINYEIGDYVKIYSKDWMDWMKTNNNLGICKIYRSSDLKTLLPKAEIEKLLGKVGKIISINEENGQTILEILVKINKNQKEKIFINNYNLLSSACLPIVRRIYEFCFNRCNLVCSKKCSLY